MDDAFYERAVAAVRAFMEERDGWQFSAQPPFVQGNSHRVVRACWNDAPVVFKFYSNPSSKESELAALRHYASSGLVPEIIDTEPDYLLVMTETPGTTLRDLLQGDSEQNSPKWPERMRQIGKAIARFAQMPLDPAMPAQVELWIASSLEASWRVYEAEPSYHTALFRQSLEMQEAFLPTVMEPPFFLYNADLNPGNILIDDGNLSGFVDVEACRPGTLALQCGGVLFSLAAYDYNQDIAPGLWSAFLEGYEGLMGPTWSSELSQASLAMAYFKYWTFIHCNAYPGRQRPSWFVLPDAVRAREVFVRCARIIQSSMIIPMPRK